MEISKQSGYKADFIESYMAQKNLLPKNFAFKKDDLDVLLKRYDKKISDFIKDTYAVKEQKNKAVQIHKLLNPKPNAPKYYTENDLANDLAHWFNNFRGDSAVIAPNFFIGDVAKIDSVLANAIVGLVTMVMQLLQIMGVVTVVAPQVLLLLPILVWPYWIACQYYRTSNRDLRRMMSSSRYVVFFCFFVVVFCSPKYISNNS